MRKNLSLFFIFSLFLAIAILAGVVVYNNMHLTEKMLEYPVKVEILNTSEPVHLVGVKGKSVMNFGGLHQNQDASIKIQLNNSYNHDVTAYPEAEGEIENWLSFSDNPVIMPANASLNFVVFMHVPENTSIGNYTGYVRLKWRK